MANLLWPIPDPGAPAPYEDAFKSFLEGAGHTVTFVDAAAAPDFTGVHGVIVGLSVGPGTIHSAYANPAGVGVWTFNVVLTDDIADGWGWHNLNTTTGGYDGYDYIAPSHPLANGRTGPVIAFTGGNHNLETGTGSNVGGGTIVATTEGSSTRRGVIGWDTGDAYHRGTIAAGRRVFRALGAAALQNLNAAGESDVLNDIAWMAPAPAGGEHTIDGAVTAPESTAAGTATAEVTASGGASTPTATGSGAATIAITASGSATAPTATAAGTVNVGSTHTLAGAVTAPTPAASGTATASVAAAGASTAPTASASGAASAAVTGQGNASAATVTASGAATIQVRASGASTAPTATVSGSATVGSVHSLIGAVTAPAATATGTATVAASASGAATAPAVAASGTATIEVVAVGAIQLAEMAVTGALEVLVAIAGGAVAPAPVVEPPPRSAQLRYDRIELRPVLSHARASLRPVLTAGGITTEGG